MNLKYLIIADDFTGSNDTGVQMTKRGIETKVMLNPTHQKVNSSVVIDTESRHLSENDAYTKVSKMYQNIVENNKFELVYKKIDSTLRGNIIGEIRAIADNYNPDKILFAPGYPKIERTVRNQIHYVNGNRLLNTEFSKDPLSPIKKDNIKEMLTDSLDEEVTHHNIDVIRNDNISLEQTKYHTFDTLTNQDLKKIAEQGLKDGSKILWVGSAGLANALFSSLTPVKPSLGVVGSISQVSLEQITYAENNGKKIIFISAKDIFNKTNIKKYVDKATDLLSLNEDVILTAAKTKADYQTTLTIGDKNNLTNEDSSWYVKNYIADITKNIIKKNEISGIYLTGGDTAISIIDKLEGDGCNIKSEIFTGIVHSELSGGNFSGLKLITKAGAFGDKTSLFKSLEMLKEL